MKNFVISLALLLSVPFNLKSEGEKTDSTQVTFSADSLAGELDSYYELDSIAQTLDYKTGQVLLNSDLAVINVPPGFSFLGAKDAQFVLSEIWGNPKDETVLGLLVPKDMSFIDPNSWAVIYSYDEDGYVKDDDASGIDYDELLTTMQEESREANEQRVKEGYSKIELIGWAQKPFYDKGAHKLHWAKELSFDGDSLHTLNYNIRMLGRKGVLVMNIISGMDNMQTVQANISKIIASTNFNNGNRYEDFNSDMDKIAEYGIGGLIAGGILAKTGVLAKIGIFLAKSWKIIALVAVGLFAAIKKFFNK